MLKMLLDPMGGIVLTNDGHAILREIEVAHPAAKSMIELSRTQDEEVGDGTTTVIVLGIFMLRRASYKLYLVLTVPPLSRRNSGACPSPARTQYSPCYHNFCLQASSF